MINKSSFNRRPSSAGKILENSLLAAAFAFGLKPVVAFSQEGSGKYDVSYVCHSGLERVLDYQDIVSKVLGKTVAHDLHVVRQGEQYCLIYDRDGSEASSELVASRHTRTLHRTGLKAKAIKDEGYYQLYNVSYGKSRNLAELKKYFAVVYSTLGEGVGKELFIEKVEGNYVLVYRRRGERQSTLGVAQKHAHLLKEKRIDASITKENNNPLVFGISSYLNEREEEKPVVTSPPKPTLAPPALPSVPVAVPPSAPPSELVPKLVPLTGEVLEERIEQRIKELRRKGKLPPDEKSAWVVYDLATEEKLVSINEDVPLQAASMVKPLVALAYFHEVQAGRLKYGPRSRRKLEASIQRSSNTATNWLINQLGGADKVQQILRQNYGTLFRDTTVVENIPRAGRTYQNRASTHDYSRFLHAVWKGEVPYAKELRRLMALPGRDRLYTGVKEIPAGTLVYDKTGSTAHLCGDMGIIVGQGKDKKEYPYTIVGVIQKDGRPRHYGPWIASRSRVIRDISGLVYTEMKGKHDLK